MKLKLLNLIIPVQLFIASARGRQVWLRRNLFLIPGTLTVRWACFIFIIILITQSANAQVVIKERVEINPQITLSNSSITINEHIFTYKLSWTPSEYHRGNIRIITCNDDTLNSGWTTSGVTTITFTANGRHHYLFQEQSWSYDSWGTGFLPGRLLQVFVDGIEKYHPQDVLGTYDGVAGSFDLNIDGSICTYYESGLSIGNIQWAECNGPNWYDTDPVELQIIEGSDYASLYNSSTSTDLGNSTTLNSKDEITNIVLKADESAPAVTVPQTVKLEANINGVVVTSETVYYPNVFEIITDVYPSEITTGEETYIDINLYNYCAPAPDETKINLEIVKGNELASLVNPYTDEISDTLTNLDHWWGYIYARVVADGKSPNSTDTLIVKVSTTDPNITPKEVPIYIIPPQIYVYTIPEVLTASDTAEVIIKKRNPDGTLEDFPPEQTFELAVADECVNGNILVDTTLNVYFANAVLPIYFVSADSVEGDNGYVRLRVGTDLGGGGASKPSRITDEEKKYLSEEQKKVKELREGYAKMIEKRKNEMVNQLNKSGTNPSVEGTIISACYIGNYIYNYGYWLGDVAVEQKYEIEIIEPTPEKIEYITSEPKMPEVFVKATLNKQIKEEDKPLIFEWEYIISKEYKRKSVGGASLCSRFSESKFHGKSYSELPYGYTAWAVPFDKDSGTFSFKSLRHTKNKYAPYSEGYGCTGELNGWYEENKPIFTGGDIKVNVIATNKSGKIIAKLNNINLGKIIGLNPDSLVVKAYTNDKVVYAIMDVEARITQFKNGNPVYGRPNGFGMTQLDDPAATESQLWNWKENVEGGKAWFYKIKEEEADKWLNQHPFNVTADMRILNAYSWYNYKGITEWKERVFYYKWDRKKWILDDRVPQKSRTKKDGTKVLVKYADWVYGYYLWHKNNN